MEKHYAVDVTGEDLNTIVKRLTGNKILLSRLLLAAAVCALVVAIITFEFVFIVLGVIPAIASFSVSPTDTKDCVRRLMQTDSLYCVNDVLNGYAPLDYVSGLAFTDTFFYRYKDKIIIKYEDVAWLYHEMTTHSTYGFKTAEAQTVIVRLITGGIYTFVLKNHGIVFGKTVNSSQSLDQHGNPIDMGLVSQVCLYNPNVLLGYTDENMREYERRVSSAKEK